MGKHKNPLSRSITVGCNFFIIILCALLCSANLALYKNYVYDYYRAYIKDILNYTLSHIDGDDLKVCIETGEESGFVSVLKRADLAMYEHKKAMKASRED